MATVLSKEQYLKLKTYFSVFNDPNLVDKELLTEHALPCLRFTPDPEWNDGKKEYDLDYIDSVVKLGTRNPWNLAQFLVVFNSEILNYL